MRLSARTLLIVIAICSPSCTWCESIRAKLSGEDPKPGPIGAALKGEYDRRAAPSEHMQTMMPRDYYR
jgi:hypothetical protein